MPGFVAAHGYAPGPSQRPYLAGALAGIMATLPAVLVLEHFGSLVVEARILGTSHWTAIVAGALLMAAAGALYARVFGRAANAVRSGWMFGLAYGFGLWAAGAVLVLPLVSGGLAPAGQAAIGLALSMMIWGLGTGLLVPFVHRPFHESLEKGARRYEVGPNAAAGRNPQRGRGSKKPATE